MRRSPRDKKKEKNVTFKTKNNAGNNETSNDITTQVELEDKKIAVCLSQSSVNDNRFYYLNITGGHIGPPLRNIVG